MVLDNACDLTNIVASSGQVCRLCAIGIKINIVWASNNCFVTGLFCFAVVDSWFYWNYCDQRNNATICCLLWV